MSVNPFCQSGVFAGKKVHLGVCGSIACYKAAELLRKLLAMQIQVSATLSAGAREFLSPLLFRALGAEPVYGEMFDQNGVFAHLEPGTSADCMVIAPASANMLAKMAQGFASDMLSAQYLAFKGPVVIAPAMNPRMWTSAATRQNVATLLERGAILAEPGFGRAACGEEGQGRLAGLTEIQLLILKALSPADMAGLKVLVTLGPTREAWDGIRFWTNPSSGMMGAALATAAWLRGASVMAICGPVQNIVLPAGIDRMDIASAREMNDLAQEYWPDMDIGLFCAAVADFAPERPKNPDAKIKKAALGNEFSLRFLRNPDILAGCARKKRPGQKILGFAAETCADMQALLALAKEKLARKGANLLAGNRLGAFGSDLNSVAIADINGREEIWPEMPKADIAWELLSWLLKI